MPKDIIGKFEQSRTFMEKSPLKHAVHCPKCNRILPPHLFHYLISRNQAIARGYSGAHPIRFHSKYCKDCRHPAERKLSKQTIAELNNLVETGDISQGHAQRLIEQKVKRKSKACSEAAKRRWERPSTQAWNDWLSYLRHEIDLTKRQRRYAKKIGDPNTIEFCDAAVLLLQVMVDRLKTREFLKETLAPGENPLQWPEPERSDVAKLWTNIVPSITKPPRSPIFL
jgi:hypothetical protein